MTLLSVEFRPALLLLAAVAAPFATAQDDSPATPEHVVGVQPYPFDTVDPREEDPPPIELPDSVAPKLELLTPEQIEFLSCGDARRFTGSVDDTVEALEERTPEEVREWVEVMQQVVDQSRYVEG